MQLDEQGYPVMLDMPVPPWLAQDARRAAAMCPALALRLTPAGPAPMADTTQRGWVGRALSGGHAPEAHTIPDLIVSEEWISEILAARDRDPGEPGDL
jgi:hypothetical protein